MGKKHAEHLATILKKYHNIIEDWEGKKYAGIDLRWDYENISCQAAMDEYILDLSIFFSTCNLKTPNFHHTNTAPLIIEPHNN